MLMLATAILSMAVDSLVCPKSILQTNAIQYVLNTDQLGLLFWLFSVPKKINTLGA